MVDYAEVRRELYSFSQEKIYGNDQLLIAENIITELKKICSKYDERVTEVYYDTLEKTLSTLQGPNAFMISVSQLTEFAKQVEENVRITYGIDHKYYKHFVEEIAPKLQQAS